MAEREPLPPGVLPNITDTDPPPLHPTTVVGDGVVYVDESKAKPPAPKQEPEPEHGRQGYLEPPEHRGRQGHQEHSGRH